MNRLKSLPIPRTLHYRVWLLTLPSALISFERRQKVPKLEIGRFRFAGAGVIAAGLALIAFGTRGEGVQIPYNGPGSQLTEKPGTTGGIIIIAGVAMLLRSAVLAGYAVALLLGAGTRAVTLEEPDIDDLVPSNR